MATLAELQEMRKSGKIGAGSFWGGTKDSSTTKEYLSSAPVQKELAREKAIQVAETENQKQSNMDRQTAGEREGAISVRTPSGGIIVYRDAEVAAQYKDGEYIGKPSVAKASVGKDIIGDYEHTGDYWKTEGGTYTQRHPGLMNPTEFYMWKRKQAGLGIIVAPQQNIADQAVIEKTFGMDPDKIPRPAVSAKERQESAEESKAISYKAATGRSTKVEAHEYIAHHAQHFGTQEAASLGAGLQPSRVL